MSMSLGLDAVVLAVPADPAEPSESTELVSSSPSSMMLPPPCATDPRANRSRLCCAIMPDGCRVRPLLVFKGTFPALAKLISLPVSSFIVTSLMML